ncbi:uncharacterized protein LOC125499671 isoform X2 [Athalia rosae]|nr:uncharacterized protein LOC125499671 isoform X2 [Athalia rosae]
MLGEIITMLEAYKSIRPYKHYRPRYPHKPRWRPGPRPKWHPHHRRPPTRHYPRYKPKYPRHRPIAHYENGIDYASDEHPYTIEIELPRRHGELSGKYNQHIYDKRGYNKGEVYDEPEYDDYLEEEYGDEQDRVIRTGKKKVRIKVIRGLKPKLNIRISRVDDVKANATESRQVLQPQISTNLDELDTELDEVWVPPNPRPSYPVHLRGA